MSSLWNTALILSASLGAVSCANLLTKKKESPRFHESCIPAEVKNDLCSKNADGFSIKIEGHYSDLVFDKSAIFTTEGNLTRAILSGALHSLSNEKVGFFGYFKFEAVKDRPSDAPFKDLKDAAYSENGGPVQTSAWTYYELVDGSLEGLNSTVESSLVSIRVGKTVHPVQYGSGANNRNINRGLSGSFEGTKRVAGFVNAVLEKDFVTTQLPSIDINIDFNCEMIEEAPDPETSGRRRRRRHDDWD
jgi:hypothetical protein